MLNKQKIQVCTEGQLVILKIGNTEIKMEYDTAIQLSTWLRVKGKEAKRFAGDDSRKWTIIGRLDTVLQGGRPW
jgi:hypothetical protein